MFTLFLSSRNNDVATINDSPGETLSEIRLYLKSELEQITFLGKQFLDVRVNEDFGADADLDSYNQCLNEVKKSDLIISLYSGRAGWAPTGIPSGICHLELTVALNMSTKKTAIIDLTRFFITAATDPAEISRDQLFRQYVTNLNRFINPLKLKKAQENPKGFREAILDSIKTIVYNHIQKRLKDSNAYYALASNNQASLDWKKMKYEDRNKNMNEVLTQLVKSNADFSTIITKCHAVPDSLSTADAKAYTGRPFLYDHMLIKKAKRNCGPIHIIAVYGKPTEKQVKDMIGFPDVSVIQDEFGMYVWEQINHIQLVFLANAITPHAIDASFLLFNNWCTSSDELDKIMARGKARFRILTAMNKAGEDLRKGTI